MAKRQMEEDQDRVWSEHDTFVCEECVDDPYLKEFVRGHVKERQCGYCKRVSRKMIAAPLEELMEPIAYAVFDRFNDPVRAGVPFDGGFVVKGIETFDMLAALPLECHDDLMEEVGNSFTTTHWVEAAGGDWMSSMPHEVFRDSWHNFVDTIKHGSRFFFGKAERSFSAGAEEMDPVLVLPHLGKLVTALGLIRSLPVSTALYRMRIKPIQKDWRATEATMGAPPSAITPAGRMNPAGISYLYVALEKSTAVAEILPTPPVTLIAAQFDARRELIVLDLTQLPSIPSMFDERRSKEREGLIFLHQFAREISQPVRKDGQEHIDYVPSQVVSEYFALVFSVGEERRIDGVAYPSAVKPGGRNVVLFPTERQGKREFNQVTFHSALETRLPTWLEAMKAIE